MKTIKTISVISLLNALIVLGFILGSNTNTQTVKTPVSTITPSVTTTVAVSPGVSSTPTTSTLVPTTALPTTTAPTTQPVTPTPACVVMISGKKYDVSQLRYTHSGGNVFICGTDMTNTFFSQHNQRMLNTTMTQYLIN